MFRYDKLSSSLTSLLGLAQSRHHGYYHQYYRGDPPRMPARNPTDNPSVTAYDEWRENNKRDSSDGPSLGSGRFVTADGKKRDSSGGTIGSAGKGIRPSSSVYAKSYAR